MFFLHVFGGFFGCSLQVCFSLTFTSQKSTSVSECSGCSCAPWKGQSTLSSVIKISSDLPETKDVSKLKASSFMCLA